MILDSEIPRAWQAGNGRSGSFPGPGKYQLRRAFVDREAYPGDLVETSPGMGGTEWMHWSGFPHEHTEPLACQGEAIHLQSDPLLPGMVVFDGLCGDPALPPEDQLGEILLEIERSLDRHGLDPTALVRTWYYLDDILDWYDRFNRIRTDWFRKHRILDGMLPASTGIGASIHGGHALRVDAIAVSPGCGWDVAEAVSPLQGPASDYGSSFSRGVVVRHGQAKGLLISGTASIDEDGNTVHIGDCEGQMMHTLEVVHAMLCEQGMGWSDVTRGIAYYLGGDERDLFRRCLSRVGAPALPLVHTSQTVCRGDLLFEMELDAWAAG